MDTSRDIMSRLIVFNKYAAHIDKLKRRETWEEIVYRNKAMHIKKFPKIKQEIDNAYKLVYSKDILPSMRSLQFAGKPIELNNARIFNCAYLPIDHPDAFSELAFLLLSGCGVGYSVQRHHIRMLPEVLKPQKTRRYLVADSLEGWSDSIKVLIKAYMGSRSSLPVFDFGDIRPKGARLKTSGGIAPGPEPLKKCLNNVQMILDRKKPGEKLRPIEVHDIACYIADCVRAGGIRRSAMIALFSLKDEEMLACKFGNWTEENPQRGRANNSVVLVRHKITEKTFFDLWEKIKFSENGEPGIYWTNDKEIGTNPCAEICLLPHQFCNLVEINGAIVSNQKDFNVKSRAASFIATLQASYTNFHYLRECWKENTEKEALIGVGLTGIVSGKVLDLDIKEAATEVVDENNRVAELIGINPAARCTTVKPSGTASLVLGCSSGIHAWHNQYYIKRLEIEKAEPLYEYLISNHPKMLEDDVLRPSTNAYACIPMKAPDEAITRNETALQLLHRVSKVNKQWIQPGHVYGENHNNVSCTVSVRDNEWDRVGKWMWENRKNYNAIATFPHSEAKYPQLMLEDIDKKTYNQRVKLLHQIDLSKIKEVFDNTKRQEEISCGGGACEV